MPTIITRSKQELLSIDFLYALAKRMKEMGFSRLSGLAWLATVIFGFEGEIRTPEGQLVEPDEDLTFNEDGSWITATQSYADRPRKRRVRAGMYQRLLLWDAAFRIIGDPIKSIMTTEREGRRCRPS